MTTRTLTHPLTTPDPIRLDVELGSGSLTVSATKTTETLVEVTGGDPEDVDVHQDGDLVTVVAPKDRGGLLGLADRSYTVSVTVPQGSALRARTGSASITARGTVRSAQARTGSGEVALERVAGPAEVTTGSGDVHVELAGGSIRVKCGSGDVVIASCPAAATISTGSGDVQLGSMTSEADVKTGSGDLRVGSSTGDIAFSTGSGDLRVDCAHRGRVAVKAASGDVRIGVPDGTPVWTDISTVTGRIRSQLASAGQPGEDQDHVAVSARTVSGDVTLLPA